MEIRLTAPLPPAPLPELGPLLGRLIAPPGDKSPAEAALETVRLDLLTELFEKAGAAREFLSLSDESSARVALGRVVWLEAWEHAVGATTRAVLAEAEQRIRAGAAVARYPAKRLAAELPDAEERQAIAARLSASGIRFEEAAEQLGDASRPWSEVLRRVAGELEAAWERLVKNALRELTHWDRRAAAVRAWRRPWLPLVLTGAALLAVAAWLGLVLGGYLQAPAWLRPLTDWVWNL